jgi:nitrogen-specific signal transduction histidine kinase
MRYPVGGVADENEDTSSNNTRDDALRQAREVGHELRNALASVLAAAEILKRRCGDDAASDVIERQVYRMKRLVDELLILTSKR